MRYLIISKKELHEVDDAERGLQKRIKAAEIVRKNYNPSMLYFFADTVGLCFVADFDSVEKMSEALMVLHRAGLKSAIAAPLLDFDQIGRIVSEMSDPNLMV